MTTTKYPISKTQFAHIQAAQARRDTATLELEALYKGILGYYDVSGGDIISTTADAIEVGTLPTLQDLIAAEPTEEAEKGT